MVRFRGWSLLDTLPCWSRSCAPDFGMFDGELVFVHFSHIIPPLFSFSPSSYRTTLIPLVAQHPSQAHFTTYIERLVANYLCHFFRLASAQIKRLTGIANIPHIPVLQIPQIRIRIRIGVRRLRIQFYERTPTLAVASQQYKPNRQQHKPDSTDGSLAHPFTYHPKPSGNQLQTRRPTCSRRKSRRHKFESRIALAPNGRERMGESEKTKIAAEKNEERHDGGRGSSLIGPKFWSRLGYRRGDPWWKTEEMWWDVRVSDR